MVLITKFSQVFCLKQATKHTYKLLSTKSKAQIAQGLHEPLSQQGGEPCLQLYHSSLYNSCLGRCIPPRFYCSDTLAWQTHFIHL